MSMQAAETGTMHIVDYINPFVRQCFDAKGA